MVTINVETYWRCPYCNSKYDNEDKARRCIEDCSDLDDPIEGETTTFKCDYCKAHCETEEDAIECEIDHIKTEDKYFFEYEIKKKKEVSINAAAHKNQTKLVWE